MDFTDIEAYFEQPLPDAYKQFLSCHKEEIGGNVYLYFAQDLIERNECYETKIYAKGYINIGDNGCGQAFIIELGGQDSEVSIVGHGSMDPEMRECVYSSFSDWVASGFQYEE